MSVEKNRFQAQRWLKTAQYDLESAEILLNNARYAHCCFLCQQAAEKALKSLYYWHDADEWGHSVLKLIEGIREIDRTLYDNAFINMKNDAVVLDKFYIPTRYPNGLPDITPDVAFTEKEARDGLRIAVAVISTVQLTVK